MAVHPGSLRVAARRTATQFMWDVAIYWAASLELRSVIQGRWRPMATRRAARSSPTMRYATCSTSCFVSRTRSPRKNAPTPADTALEHTIRHRVLRYFHRHGLLERHVTHDMLTWRASGCLFRESKRDQLTGDTVGAGW